MRFFVSILIVCLLGSCASVNNGFIIKRKYNKGYYINIASHKRSTGTKQSKAAPSELKHETTEIFVVDQRQKEFPHPNSQEDKPKQNSQPSYTKNKPLSCADASPIASRTSDIKENVSEKLSIQIGKQSRMGEGAQFSLYLILFLILTIIYTFVLVANTPSFPILLAIPIAMIGALLTLLTGVMFI
jgi:hypothetical protein